MLEVFCTEETTCWKEEMLYSGYVVRRNGKLREVMQRKRHIYDVFAGRKEHSQRTLRCVGAGRWYYTGNKLHVVSVSPERNSMCRYIRWRTVMFRIVCRQETAYSRRVLRRESEVNQDDLHGRYCMLRHHTGQRQHIDDMWQGYSNLNDVFRGANIYWRLRAIRKEHTEGILQEINAHCHVTGRFVDMKRRVQRVMWYKGAC